MDGAARISTKGQVVIPSELRKKHQLQPGTQVQIFEYGDLICIAPMVRDAVDAAYGSLPAQPSLAEELRDQREKDFSR